MKKRLKRQMRLMRYVVYKETLVDFKEHVWTFLGSFVGIGLIGFLNSKLLSEQDNFFMIGSFGASAVLVYGIVNSPLAQPRNLIGGHLIAALVGVTVRYVFPGEVWLCSALAVSLSIVLMQVTKTLHPPGGATALIANIGSEKVKNLGFLYVVSPVLTGVLILFFTALIFNSLSPHRTYPSNRKWYRLGIK